LATDHHLLDVGDRSQLPRRAHQQLLAVALDVTGATVVVVGTQGLNDILQRNAELQQAYGIGGDMVLLVEATNGVDLHHTCDLSQLRLDDPVLHLAQGGSVIGQAIGLLGTRLRLNRIHEDLAEPRGNRPHLRLQPGWQSPLDRTQALIDQIAGEEDIGAFLEDHRHLRQPVAREGTGVLQVGQTVERRLHREGDALLRLQRRIARCLGVDLHLDVGDIGYCVDGKALIAPEPHPQQDQDQAQH